MEYTQEASQSAELGEEKDDHHHENEEQEALFRCILSYKNYSKYAESWLSQMKANFEHFFSSSSRVIPSSHYSQPKRAPLPLHKPRMASKSTLVISFGDTELDPSKYMLPSSLVLKFKQKLDGLRRAIQANQKFFDTFVPPMDQMELSEEATEDQMETIGFVLGMFVRDWSAEASEERKQCYGPLLNELYQLFPENRNKIKVLCPGCGLGRLPLEIAMRGFNCQGNEFAFSNLLPTNTILNKVERIEQFEIFPYVMDTSNNFTIEDQIRSVKIPDVLPSDIPKDITFSMNAGDFLELYSDPQEMGEWNVVVTSFFIDTARNLLDYVAVIHSVLKMNGIWLNLGPLQYHFSSVSGERCIEFSFEEIRELLKHVGFTIEKEEIVDTTYCRNSKSMLTFKYNAPFFVARKTQKEPSTSLA